MKHLTFILSVLLFVSCGKDNPKPEESPSNKTLVRYEAYLTPFKFGVESPSSKFLVESKEFDANGRVTVEKSRSPYDTDKNDDITTTYTYKYDGDKLSEMKKDGLSSYRYTYSYSGNNLVEEKEYGQSGLYQRTSYEYSNGKKSKAYFYITISSKESLLRTETYLYDQSGNLSQITAVFTSDDSGYKLLYEHDSHNNIIKETYVDESENRQVIQIDDYYTYTKDGKIDEYIDDRLYGIFYYKTKHFYDESGNLIKKDVFKSSSKNGSYEQISTIQYTYTYN